MKISLIIPSRNNLKYLRWAYNSIRKNQGDHEVEICVADDASTDMTWKWCQEKMNYDPYFKAIRNNGPERQGLVILNDKLINEVATNDICMVYHADMYLCPGAIDAIEKHMYGTAEEPVVESRIVSLTRIEPPLHPPGPEKVLQDFGIEPEEFDEEGLLEHIKNRQSAILTSEGIFAPWAFWKEDFQQIGGHDILFAPQSKEDSDIFNRFHLNEVEFVQTWEGFVYHMTSRGSRFNPSAGGAPGQDSPEWIGTTTKNTREFIRKWGHMIQHDKYMKPIVPPKYNVGIRIENCRDLQLLEAIEPWCDIIYTDGDIDNYIAMEQPKTSYDLSKRVHSLTDNDRYDYDDILIEIDGNTFSNESFRHIQHLSEILANDNLELGTFKLGDIKITINNIETYEKDLIICKK
jgi:glycosyltransferase involved in cell wall biosynthesis